MNKIPREEITAIVFFMLLFISIGAIGGYYGRSLTSRDRWLVSVAAKNQAQETYYQQQLDELVEQEKTRRQKNGK